MPYRKFKRRRRRKRRFRRRRRKPRLRRTSRRISSLRLRQPSMIPDNLYIKLKWTEIRNTANAFTDKQAYELNGAAIPVASAPTVTQPMGWDQWSRFYQRYECFGSQINVLIANRAATNLVGTSVVPLNDSGIPLDFNEVHTQPYATTRYTSGSNGKAFARIKKYMSVKKLEARSTTSQNFTGETADALAMPPTIGTLPDIRKFWVIFSQTMNLVTTIDVFYDVTITYYLRFFLRRSMDAS